MAKTDLARLKGKKASIITLPLCMDSEALDAYETALTTRQTHEATVTAARRRAEVVLKLKFDDDPEGLIAAVDEHPAVRDAQAELDALLETEAELKAVMDDETVTFKFRAIPVKVRNRLVKEHPPTEEQNEEFKREMAAAAQPESAYRNGLEYNADSFPPALIAATLVHPKLDAEEVDELIWSNEEWNDSERAAVFQAAVSVMSKISALPR